MRDHGIDISDLRARHFRPSDFHGFDVLLAMDKSNLTNMLAIAPDEASKKGTADDGPCTATSSSRSAGPLFRW